MPDSAPTSPTRVAVAASAVLLAAAAGYLLWSTAEVLLLMFAGVLLALFLHGLAYPFTRYLRLPHGLAFALACLLFFGAIAGVLWVFGPLLVKGGRQLIDSLPDTVDQLMTRFSLSEEAVTRAMRERTAAMFSPQSLARIAGMFSTLLGAAMAVFIVLVTGLYVGAEPRLYRTGMVKLFPKLRRRRMEAVLHSIGRTLGWWLAGRVVSMTVVGVLTWAGLMLLGLPFGGILALLAGLLSFIPNLGPVLSALPAVLVGLAKSPQAGLYVVGVYAMVQAIESYLITPMIERRAVMMPPALSMAAQLVFGTLFGMIGLLVAAPLTLTVLVTVKMLYVQDVLQDDVELV